MSAKLLGKKQQWQRAADLLEGTMPGASDNAERSYYLSHCYFELGKFKDAIGPAENALAYGVRDVRRLHRLGSLYARTSNHEAAAKIFEELTELQPDKADWHYYLGNSLMKVKENARGLEELRTAATLDPQNRKYVVRLSNEFRARKIFWEDELLLDRSLPNTPEERLAHGRAQFRMNRFEKAGANLSEVASSLQTNAEVAYEAGLAFELSGKVKDSKEQYQIAIQRDTNLDAKKLGIGAFHAKAHNWDLAAKAYEDAWMQDTSSGELCYRTALAYDRLFRWTDAEVFYRRAVTLDPSKGRWHYKYGLSLERQNKWDEAARVYSYAANTFKNKYWFYRAGLTLFEAGRFEESFEYLGNSLENFEAISEQFEHSFDLADMGYLREILADDVAVPVNRRVSWFKERALFSYFSGNTTTAIDYLTLASLGSNRHDPKLIVALGVLKSKNNDWRGAAEALRNVRVFKWQDGVDVEKRTKNANVRNIAEYAEYYEDLPVKQDVILWQSNGGESVGCHPLALFQELVKTGEVDKYLHIWVLNDFGSDVPEAVRNSDRVIFVKRHSDGYRRALATAKYLVNNSTFPGYYIRKAGQQYLNTWHGTPYKTLGKDMRGEMFKHAAFVRDILQSTHLISPNRHTTNVLLDSHDVRGLFSGKLAEIGSPRIDTTLNLSDTRRAEILRVLDIDDDRPVVLYAPTWRGLSNEADVNTDQLQDHLKVLAGIDGHLIFRAHRLEEQSLKGVDVAATVAPASIDTNELLAVVDVLVTDYSSVFYDYLPRMKPIVFFMHDQDEYLAERGVYFDNDELPGFIETTAEDTATRVNSLLRKPNEIHTNHESSLAEFASREDGNAAKRVLDFWLRGEYNDGIVDTTDSRKVLVFQQSMIPTGMSSSFLNLVNALDSDTYRVVLLVEPRLIRAEPGRQETISRLPQHVQVIGRSGGRVMTPEDMWVSDRIDRSYAVPSRELWSSYLKSYEREARRIFGESKIDASIQFDGYVPFWNALSATLGDKENTSKIIYLHNDMYEEWSKRWPNLATSFSMYSEFDSLISVSETMMDVNRSNLVEHFGVATEKFDYCENMINFEDVLIRSQEPLPSEYESLFDGSRTVFLTSGRLSIEKDQQKLIRAFAIHRAADSKAHLVLLGDGPLRAELQSLVRELNLGDSVTFVGRVPNPYPFVARADCFVLPSNHEGQPMVLLEAMVLDRKIVATNIPGSAHVLKDGFGLIVDNSVEGVLHGLQQFVAGEVPNRKFDYNEYSQAALSSFESHLSS